MPYKVFLVEDEVTTREGIRDNVDWRAAGFELCGEAADGEIALSQIEAKQPDVLITDIKMPFMDGLQLCKIIREHWAWMKIIIISGHSDFQYAQEAIKLGATEYLLKPVSVKDLQEILVKVAVILGQEKSERAYLKQLSRQVEDNLHLQREKFLLRLVTGGESSLSAIEQSQELGLTILAPFYLVIVLAMRNSGTSHADDFALYRRAEDIIAGMINANPDVLLARAGMDEFVMILKGESLEQLDQESAFLAKVICEAVANQTGCNLAAGIGAVQQRLGDLHRSYADALMQVDGSPAAPGGEAIRRLDHAGLRHYLESGSIEGFDACYDQFILPLVDASENSTLLRQYVFVDIALTASQLISDLGGDAKQVIQAQFDEEAFSGKLASHEQFRRETSLLFADAFAFRQSLAASDRSLVIQQAKAYIAGRFSDANFSLSDVATQVNFSPNHFSAVFREETGTTFRDYLTHLRIEQAKKLLRNARLKCAEVAYQCGYNDSHYFSMIFRKKTGLTPQQYRETVRE